MPALRLLAACTVLLVAAAPAAAQEQRPSSAQRMADAVLRAKVRINAQRPAIEQRLEELELNRCIEALSENEPPKRSEERAGLVLIFAFVNAVIEPSKTALEQMQADLDAIPTRDRILRSGRSAWRWTNAMMYRVPVLAEPCTQLERWAGSGYDRDLAPKFSVRDSRRLLAGPEVERAERKLRSAARRMRVLGVSRGDARRFTGTTLFTDAIPEDAILDALGMSSEAL